MEVSSFDEFVSSLDQIQSTGGTIALAQDIIVPAEESYTYNNGRYRQEVVIETQGHTINIEGYLELWPFLTIRGDSSQKELFHIYPGGELRLVSICLEAGENGIAVIQEEGAFLVCGSEEGMGLPAFSCTGQIISSQTMTAAAYWSYNCEKLPVVRVPHGADFTADMLPHQVLSVVNRGHQEYEEEVPVVWDETTFPIEQERTLVQGKFADGYSQYEGCVPRCLVVWESDTCPFFLNVYLESAAQWCDMVFMYGEAPQSGTVCIQSSDDGENWTDLADTDGYAPAEAEENESFSWILSYDKSDSAQKRPRYYRMLQILDDGTALYSDALELSDDLIFTAADIEGGRGGETSPNEGEDQPTNGMPHIPEADNAGETLTSESSDSSSGSEADMVTEDSEQAKDEIEEQESHGGAENTEQSSNYNVPAESAGSSSLRDDLTETSSMSDDLTDAQPEESEKTTQGSDFEIDLSTGKTDSEQIVSVATENGTSGNTDVEKIAGTAMVVCILAGSVVFFVSRRKR